MHGTKKILGHKRLNAWNKNILGHKPSNLPLKETKNPHNHRHKPKRRDPWSWPVSMIKAPELRFLLRTAEKAAVRQLQEPDQ